MATFDAPGRGGAAYEEYVSDPSKPVPYRSRPNQPAGSGTWSRWLVDDQREASGRPDVLAFATSGLKAPVKISGQPIVHLVASTSGTDSDWVVKVIDVYRDDYPDPSPNPGGVRLGGFQQLVRGERKHYYDDEAESEPAMGGYHLMIAADIFRGRYRESLETAKAIPSDTPQQYVFALPTANHVFLPGHRLMVQVQSTWFPLYDRNPQTFVRNIFRAKPSDFKAQQHRIWHTPRYPSHLSIGMLH